MRSGVLGGSRPNPAARSAGLGAAAVLLAVLAGCGPAPPGSAVRPRVMLTSGVYHGVWWGVWAWSDGGTLCMAMAGHGGPSNANPPERDADGGACGFARKPSYPHYYDSGPGPAGSYFSIGPLPLSAIRIRVAAGRILPTRLLPQRAGLPAGRYWVEIVPASGLPKADGTMLSTAQPLNSAGQPVPFQAF
jgi:hypothetical protein